MINETFKRILSSIIIIPIALFFIIKGSAYFIFFLITFFLISSYEWFSMIKKKIHLYTGVFFLSFSFYAAYLLRGTSESELVFFLFIILICVASDVGGYIFGKLFKGPKLSKISPNKTYSGMIGSYFFSIICAYLYLNEYPGEIGTELNWVFFDSDLNSDLVLLLTAFLISSVNQLGDLTVSYFKRLSKIKNTGKILPGHGGLLDRVDGIIFVIPFAYLFLNFIKL